ncbi:MAG: YhjD/YihY/BrkB family envelope integrity protein [Microbacterium sp.]
MTVVRPRAAATDADAPASGALARAGALTQRTLASFPVRVWRHFLDHSGFLLAAGVSYQAMFAVFAAIYVAFAAAGIWLGASPAAINALIEGIDRYVPGIIADDGLFTPAQVAAIATDARSVLALTGSAAVLVAVWTAIAFISFARRAVRTMLVLPPDRRGVVMLKLRDLVAALVLAAALVIGFSVGSAGTWALEAVFDAFGWDTHSHGYLILIAVASVVVSFAVYALTLGMLLRFLTGTALDLGTIRSGSLLAAAGITVLQLATGYLLGAAPRNPLMATVAIFVGLLTWFQATGVMLLSAAAWIAVAAHDRDIPLLAPSEAERRAAEHEQRIRQARERVRAARDARATTPWWRAWQADRAVRDALDDLFLLEASTPPS